MRVVTRALCLGIESSCDETAAAVVDGGRMVLSSVIASQALIHARYGGVVPEVAARHHLEAILPVVDTALREARTRWDDLHLVAVTRGPGLPAALLVGLAGAKAIALARGLPLVGVNHLMGHIYAAVLSDREPDQGIGWPAADELPRPSVALVVSGSHTDLCLLPNEGGVRVLGTTLDDAAGEAFDKVARLLDLGYPGGPELDRLAQRGNPQAIPFPRITRSLAGPRDKGGAGLVAGEFAFSFSGLKTSVAVYLEQHPQASIADVAASFQQAVVDTLVTRTLAAAERSGVRHVIVTGGVSANSSLRSAMDRACAGQGYCLHVPPLRYCTDNAAMIAAAGWTRYQRSGADGWDLDVAPGLTLEMDW